MSTAHILVTGGSRGIGAATCRLAGARGWNVTVNYVSDAAAAESVVAEVKAAGGNAVAVAGDVAKEADVIGMFDAAEATLGPLTGVVANAGIIAPAMPLTDMTLERIQRVIDINVTGAILTAREAARRLSTDRGGAGGALVLLSSVAAKLGAGGTFVEYAASKGAMESLMAGLTTELAPKGIRVNAVRPGLIDTEIHADGGDPDRAKVLGKTVPMGRAGSAEEVAQAIVWLLSEDASYVAGANVDVTGGR